MKFSRSHFAAALMAAEGRLQTVEVYNGFVAWRQPWNEQWRSNLALSAFPANIGQLDSGSMFGTGVSRNVRSATASLPYSPIAKITFGVEYRYARRTRSEICRVT